MAKFRLFLIWIFLAALAVSCHAQPVPLESAHHLIKDMVYNELKDRDKDSYWQYQIVKTTGNLTVLEHQVETRDGPIYRILERNGAPLTGDRLRAENDRIERLLHSPSELAKNKQDHDQDEQRLRRLMRLMPQAFVFDYAGPPSGNFVTVKFRPNPAFTPPTYESRVYHGLAGTCVVNLQYKRLVRMKGKLIARINFGFGLLGHVEKGGTFEIAREQVSPTHWRTDLVDVHVQGRVILFKTITKDEHEVRSHFQIVPVDITLAQAARLLDAAAASFGESVTLE